MKLYYILTIFLLISCQNDDVENNKILESDTNNIIIESNTVRDTLDIENSNSDVFDLHCNEDGIIVVTDSVSNYISPEGLKLINEALGFYSSVKTDSAMAEFYFKYLDEVSDTLNIVFYKYTREYEEINWNFVEEWNIDIGNCISFMIFIFDNTFDGPIGYEYYSALKEKSKLTSGKGDDAFFNTLITCYGEYPSIYQNFFIYYVDSRGYPSFGMGNHYTTLKSVIAADTTSNLFNDELEKIAESILKIEDLDYFAASKEKVYHEIELLLSLKDSTRFDLSNAFKLKLFLDTTTQTVYYNCLNNDCPE